MKRDPQSFKRAKFRILKNPQRVRAKFRGSDSISSLRIQNGAKMVLPGISKQKLYE
jgi:hypothetical protein